MERVERIDPDLHAATRRLLIATALSVLLHGLAVWFGPGRSGSGDVTAPQNSIIAPPSAALLASLQNVTTASRAGQVQAAGPANQFSAMGRLATMDPRYYRVEELDVLPTLRQPVRLHHVLPALGKVRVLTRIDASGRITEVSVFDSEATTNTQNSAALNALRGALFTAARKQGQVVRSEVVIELVGGSGR